MRYIIQPCHKNTKIYAKEVENNLSKLSLYNYVKDIIRLDTCGGHDKISSF